ncbi:TonB-like protein [Bosea sp. LC85]|nr:TonB-like protein [Bosea sp. LC85]
MTPEPIRLPEPEIKLPELPQLPDAAAVLAPPPPAPPPVPEKPKAVERKPTPPKPRVVERRKPVEREKEAAAPPATAAPAAAPSAAPTGAAASSSASTASWRGMLIAHLNRYKRFPGGARPGTVQIAFSIDRGGRVLAARLAGSSGDPTLDEEAVSMIRRASPVPAPPAGVGGGGTISLAVPVRYNR